MFGKSKLQDEIFCLTEERDYFQAKFLEQVSEIAHLKDGLGRAKKEIDRLRKELMARGVDMHDDDDDEEEDEAETSRSLQPGHAASHSSPAAQSPRTPNKKQKQKKNLKNNNSKTNEDIEEEEKKDDTSDLTAEDEEEDHDDEEEDNDANDIRQSAEKLLQWASYRSLTRTSVTASTPEHLSVASPRSHNSSSMLLLQERPDARRLGRGIPSSVQLDAALSEKQEAHDDDYDEKTLSSTASSEGNNEQDSVQEIASEEDEPPRRGKKLLQKFEHLVTSL
jgi:hypothetical protein